jgi:FtsP/CotA-like multicopper oxidase with cupredoxin domain
MMRRTFFDQGPNARRNTMNRRLLTISSAVVAVFVFLMLFSLPAIAGPGGGTFYANSPAGGPTGTAIRKFVDALPGICEVSGANTLGQCIPLAAPDTSAFPGSDYYEIGLRDYTEQMHSDLPKATKIRGYIQINAAGTSHVNHYLGPLILATTNRPVRVKFTNSLGINGAGDLFIPVDTTYMGAGAFDVNSDPTNSLSSHLTGSFSQNRATLHLHGGNTPWISDGTPHQWTVPKNENTTYKRGMSSQDVPDMWFDGTGALTTIGTGTTYPGDGSMTFFWTNQQSGRLMFYHDHAYGITRLNVYAGEAAGYLLVDPVEENALKTLQVPGYVVTDSSGAITSHDLGHLVPLVIEDKTFVPQNVATQDAKWTDPRWGTYGDLWFPHVYETNQDPNSPNGANPFGRWDYGPWFWPPMDPSTLKGPLPDVSGVPEAFMDTPIVNGTAYPYIDVDPTAYRFKILNACNDRMLNLSLFTADTGTTGYYTAAQGYTEVKMVAAVPNALFPAGWPADGRDGGVPDPAAAGPSWIQIGSEGGILPEPAVIAPQPVGYDYNRRNIVVLNVLQKGLFMGPAERADVVVDFSAYAGQTVILYNDAPAPVPAFDVRNDYYTGDPDNTFQGGAPTTLPGYGPNTRTIMQFRVRATAATPPVVTFNEAALSTGLPAIYSAVQPTTIVPESAYSAAYGSSFQDQYIKIADTTITYTPICSSIPVTAPLLRKAIQELFTTDYGRMNATLGTEMPLTNFFTQTTIPLAYVDPTTETIQDGETQFWKITHNGVDTHAIHFHLVNVQVINRVGWDGAIRPPDANEMGWKDTVRMHPLEDIVVAVRPKTQTLPFSLPTSRRLLDPTQPTGSAMNFTLINPFTNNAESVANEVTDFGYEYVWHCHLLGHEENDMMRPIIFRVPASAPNSVTGLAASAVSTGVTLSWTAGAVDNTNVAIGFRIERSPDNTTFAPLAIIPAGAQTYRDVTTYTVPLTFTDTDVLAGTQYWYKVYAYNTQGDSAAAGPVTATTGGWTGATGAGISASPASPHNNLGGIIAFTATGAGGQGAYDYEFLLTNGTTTVVQAYSSSNQWMWDSTGVAPGTYTVTVYVRNAGSLAAVQAQASMSYTISSIFTVTLTPSVASPQLPGASIGFTAAASGGSGSYEYQFQLLSGGTWSTVQNFSTTSTWTWNTTVVAPGAYAIQVLARNSGSAVVGSATQVGYVLTGPATGATLTPSIASPMASGGIVTFTAAGIGGSGTYEYQFWLNTGGVWSITQQYSTTNTWTWNTSGVVPGSYNVAVRVRNAGSTALLDVVQALFYTVVSNSPVTSATLTPNPVGPQAPGTSVVFTAAGIGGSGNYEYEFWLNTSGVWAIVRPYSTTNSWTWNTTGVTPGSYNVAVRVRNAGSTVPLDVVQALFYSIEIPVSGATLLPNVASPQIAGTSVIFTAAGTGGSGTYEYQFWLNTGGVWAIVQPYSATNTWTWNTTGVAAGSYNVAVRVRNAGSSVLLDVVQALFYDIQASNPVTGATLTPNVASPQAAGTSIIFTAAGIGGSGSYEYEFWLNTGTWAIVQAYSTTNTWTWNTTGVVSGSYNVAVRVRNAGSSVLLDTVQALFFTITP